MYRQETRAFGKLAVIEMVTQGSSNVRLRNSPVGEGLLKDLKVLGFLPHPFRATYRISVN